MMDRVMALLSFLMLVGFLGILVSRVPRWDLTTIVAITLLLVAVDFIRTFWSDRRSG